MAKIKRKDTLDLMMSNTLSAAQKVESKPKAKPGRIKRDLEGKLTKIKLF